MNITPKQGTTLIELVVVLSIVSALALVALPASFPVRDRAAVRSATTEIAAALATARAAALARSGIVAFVVDSASGSARVVAGADTLLDLPLRPRYRVGLRASRDSIAYGPTGRGYGAANTTITIQRGRAQDTITVSRLGRVRT